MSTEHVRLVVCVNERLGQNQKSCAGSGSRQLIKLLQQHFDQADLNIPIVEQVCLGRCEQGVAMRIAPGGPFFVEVKTQDLKDVVKAVQKFNHNFSKQ